MFRSHQNKEHPHQSWRLQSHPVGYTPEDFTSLTEQDPEEHLGVHQNIVDEDERPTSQEAFMRQLRPSRYQHEDP